MSNNVLACFDGHSGGRIAFEVLGITPGKYYASEVDKYAIEGSMAVFPNTIQLGDITRWREWTIDWCSLDWFIGGSPCQGFSMAGKMAGTTAVLNGEKIVVDSREKYLYLKSAGAEFLSQSYLFWEYILCLDFVKMCNPKIKFFLENVKMKKEFLDLISNAIGVEPVFINSALVSAQNRQRFYWCNWGVEQPKDKGIVLKDILESEVESKFFHTDSAINYMQQGNEKWQQAGARRADRYTQSEDKEKSFCLTANMHKGVPYNYLEVKCAAQRGRYDDNGEIQQQFEVRKDEKTNALTTVQKDNFVIQRVATASDIKGHDYNKRIYSPNGKAPTLAAATGGNLEPKVSISAGCSGRNPRIIRETKSGKALCLTANYFKGVDADSRPMVTTPDAIGKEFKECLKNIHYRKLTPRECGRLQTIPEDILDTLLSAGISNSQLYKMFGNGWTIDVIAHIFTLMQIDRML